MSFRAGAGAAPFFTAPAPAKMGGSGSGSTKLLSIKKKYFRKSQKEKGKKKLRTHQNASDNDLPDNRPAGNPANIKDG